MKPIWEKQHINYPNLKVPITYSAHCTLYINNTLKTHTDKSLELSIIRASHCSGNEKKNSTLVLFYCMQVQLHQILQAGLVRGLLPRDQLSTTKQEDYKKSSLTALMT